MTATSSLSPPIAVEIGALHKADVEGFAALFVSSRVSITPEESAEFYATERGRKMQNAINALRLSRKGKVG